MVERQADPTGSLVVSLILDELVAGNWARSRDGDPRFSSTCSEGSAGTLVNILLIVPAAIAWTDERFQRETDGQVSALFARASSADSRVVASESLDPLPPPVRCGLEGAGVVGKRVPHTVRLEQRGQMRLGPGKKEVQAAAQQYFRVDEPEFVWRVRLRLMRILPVVGRDTYADGRGRLLIKLASLVPVVDATGEKIDQGTLLRFLAEIVWLPAAALSPFVCCEPIDQASAKATMTYGGVSGSAVFSFDDKGRFTGLAADRYFGGGPAARLERWEVEATDWDTMDGRLVPVGGEVRWKLESRDNLSLGDHGDRVRSPSLSLEIAQVPPERSRSRREVTLLGEPDV